MGSSPIYSEMYSEVYLWRRVGAVRIQKSWKLIFRSDLGMTLGMALNMALSVVVVSHLHVCLCPWDTGSKGSIDEYSKLMLQVTFCNTFKIDF